MKQVVYEWIKKITRNDNILSVTINLKAAAVKKSDFKCDRLFSRWIFGSTITIRFNNGIWNIYNKDRQQLSQTMNEKYSKDKEEKKNH